MTVANSLGIPSKTRRVNDTAGVLKNRVVVQGTGPYEVKNPAAANASKIEGVVEYLGPRNGGNSDDVGVRNKGEAVCIAASAIAVGDYVNIADTAGRVKAVSEALGVVVFLVGRAVTSAAALGDEITVNLDRIDDRYTV